MIRSRPQVPSTSSGQALRLRLEQRTLQTPLRMTLHYWLDPCRPLQIRLNEEGVEGRVEGDGLDEAGKFSGGGVAAEDGDGGGVLVAAEQPLGGGIEGEVPGGFAAAGDALDEVEFAVFGADG